MIGQTIGYYRAVFRHLQGSLSQGILPPVNLPQPPVEPVPTRDI